MHWFIKAAVQKVLSILPWKYGINYLIQKYITVGKALPAHFVEDRLMHARKHATAWKQFGNIEVANTHVMETGTGWYPIVPVAMFLLGFRSVVTTDVRKLLHLSSVKKTLHAILLLHRENKLALLLPDYQPERIGALKNALQKKSTEEILRSLSIRQIVSDIDHIPIPSGCIDLLISNNTLQFIPATLLPGYLTELQRIASDGAVFSMAIDFTDEFSHSDPSIGSLHFLRYSDRVWNLFSSPLYAPNRLRYSDFRGFFSNGPEILSEEVGRIKPEAIGDLKISKRFADYDNADLLISHAHFVGRMQGRLPQKTDIQTVIW